METCKSVKKCVKEIEDITDLGSLYCMLVSQHSLEVAI